jgi:hypothetical protein
MMPQLSILSELRNLDEQRKSRAYVILGTSPLNVTSSLGRSPLATWLLSVFAKPQHMQA